jgi:small subunit ribosomal protein S1
VKATSVLSREKAEKMKIWDEVEKAYQERKVVIGRVIERIKGGLAVDIGVRAFLPGSQIDVRPVRNLDALRGQELRMRVIKVNKKRGNIVLSRKVLLEEENAEKKKTTLDTLARARSLRGTVKNLTDYGAFIDLGRHRRPAAHHGHVVGPRHASVGSRAVGDEIDVIVLKYDSATERVSLGPQADRADPWSNFIERYPVGIRVTGKVVSLTDYGAFIELEPGVEGPHPRLRNVVEQARQAPVEDSQPGRSGRGDGARRRSRRAPDFARPQAGREQSVARARGEVPDRHDDHRQGPQPDRVRRVRGSGRGIDGLIHISDMSWSKIKHPSEVLKKGDTVEAQVLSIDADNQRLSLGLKQLQTASGRVLRQAQGRRRRRGQGGALTNFGAFVELADGIEGLIHVSEFDSSQGSEKLNCVPGRTTR